MNMVNSTKIIHLNNPTKQCLEAKCIKDVGIKRKFVGRQCLLVIDKTSCKT